MGYTKISNGTLPDATEVMGNFDASMALGSSSFDLAINYKTHAFTSDEAVTKTNFVYDATDDNYVGVGSASVVLEMPSVGSNFFRGSGVVRAAYLTHDAYVATVYDECDNSSADATLWDVADVGTITGTLSEDTDRLQYTATDVASLEGLAILTDGTNGVFTTETVIFRCSVTMNTTASNRLSVSDGTNRVTLDSADGASQTLSGTYVVKLDSSTDEAWVWKDGAALSGSPFDISSVTGGFQIEIRTVETLSNAGPHTATARMFFFRVIDGTETTTFTELFSSDGGSNFTAATNGHVAIIAAERENQMRTRLTSTVAATEVVVVNSVFYQGILDSQDFL